MPLEIIPVEAEEIRWIFRRYLQTRSLLRVQRELWESGSLTRRDCRWSRAGLAWLLKNDTYIGRVHFGVVRRKAEHPAIIAPIVFYKVQQLLRKNDKTRYRKKSCGAEKN